MVLRKMDDNVDDIMSTFKNVSFWMDHRHHPNERKNLIDGIYSEVYYNKYKYEAINYLQLENKINGPIQ